MEILNTEEKYGIVSKAFHWIIAVLILALLPIGLFMGTLDNSPFKFQIFALHKEFGLLVFFLGVARIVWRFFSPPPDHLDTHAHWEVTLASAAHFWLYVCIIGMPLSGWLMSSAGQFPIPFFGLQMPSLIGADEKLMYRFGQIHEILAYTLLFVLALHIAGALKHHVLDKDETVKRMTWAKAGWGVVAAVVIYAGLSYAQSARMIVTDLMSPESEEQESAVPVATATPSKPVDVSQLAEHGWAIDPSRSKLQFQAVLYNAPFTGTFSDFNGTIVFDPADLSTAKADIVIAMKDVKTGDTDRDSNIQSTEWFDSAQFPEAHFVTKSFEKADGGNYVAVGDVTIKGVTMPLLIPFSLEIKDMNGKKEAHMVAKFSLDRTHFGIGTSGQWEKDTSVDKNVDVAIDLIAIQ